MNRLILLLSIALLCQRATLAEDASQIDEASKSTTSSTGDSATKSSDDSASNNGDANSGTDTEKPQDNSNGDGNKALPPDSSAKTVPAKTITKASPDSYNEGKRTTPPASTTTANTNSKSDSKGDSKSDLKIESRIEPKIDPKTEILKKDLTTTKETMAKQETSARVIMSSLFAINKKLKKIVTEKSNLDQQKLSVQESANNLTEQMAAQELELQAEKQLLMKRLGTIYRFGGQGSLRVLFASHSSADLERNLKILGLLAKRDLDLAKNYHESVLELTHKKSTLQKKLAKLEHLTSGIKVQEKLLAHEDQEKSKYLNQLKKSRSMNEKKLSDLRAKSKEVAETDSSGLLDLLLRPSFAEQKGQLEWPIKGTLKQKFGIYHDAQYPVVLSNKGIFVSSSKGAAVHSVFSGRVAYQGDVDGFGHTLIIDHGDHYYSVYSNIGGVEVGLGDEVQQNQVVAKSGLDPARSLEGIYFEIRHFSEPSDPAQWMKGSLQ